MTTQTIDREELYQTIDGLPDDAVERLASYAAFLRYENDKPHIPNTETAAAIRDGRAGKVKSFHNVDALLADLRNDNDD
jgi:hypothetical protein